MYDHPYYDYDDYDAGYDYENEPIDGVGFADPGGNSALRAATRDNPRNLHCPSCGGLNRLTPIDKQRGYQCNQCAEAAERGVDGPDHWDEYYAAHPEED